jgi:hypothetical protein
MFIPLFYLSKANLSTAEGYFPKNFKKMPLTCIYLNRIKPAPLGAISPMIAAEPSPAFFTL